MPTVWRAAAVWMMLGLSGCATGQDSLVAISPSEDASASSSTVETPFAGAPTLLAVSGTALLPGARFAAAFPARGEGATDASLTGAPALVDTATGVPARLLSPNGLGALPTTATLAASSAGVQTTGALSAPGVGPPLSPTSVHATGARPGPRSGPLLSAAGGGSRLAGAVAATMLATATRAQVGLNVGPLAVAPTQIAVSTTAALSRAGLSNSGGPMAGPRLPITANPALLSALTGRVTLVPGGN